ncbi:MAG TPA: serine hydrolase [Vicinamibacterales bacterium]|jgi:beta-lactamase class A|nr:serine hydrolase [Vicinamibacterales bacterium]
MYARVTRAAVLSALTVFSYVVLAGQQSAPAISALNRLFRDPLQANWFAPTMLAQVPMERLELIVKGLLDTNGVVTSVQPAEDGRFLVVFKKASVPTQITLDTEGRITGLFFAPPVPNKQTVDAVLPEFARLPGRVSVTVTENGRARAGFQSDRSLAVGSSFKLAILAALAEQVSNKTRGWNDVVLLRPEWKSLPSGVLQGWPDGTPLTLAALANQMISISDNTAADGLLDIAGRQAVERQAPRNRPFLTSRQMFILKADGNTELLRRYQSADEGNRRLLLKDIDSRPLPAAAQIRRVPTALDVEWFFTTDELCGLIEKVAGLPAFRINPGLVDPSAWGEVAFKGGSEPGVLNLTTALKSKSGRQYCVAATWNDDSPVDENRFATLYRFLLAALDN